MIAELTGFEPALWVSFYLLACLSVLRQFVLLPRAIAKSHRSVIGKTDVVRLDDDGVHDEIGGIHTFVEWSALTGVSQNAATVGIRLDRRGGLAIPKRAFATPAESEAFLDFARSHLPARPAIR